MHKSESARSDVKREENWRSGYALRRVFIRMVFIEDVVRAVDGFHRLYKRQNVSVREVLFRSG